MSVLEGRGELHRAGLALAESLRRVLRLAGPRRVALRGALRDARRGAGAGRGLARRLQRKPSPLGAWHDGSGPLRRQLAAKRPTDQTTLIGGGPMRGVRPDRPIRWLVVADGDAATEVRRAHEQAGIRLPARVRAELHNAANERANHDPSVFIAATERVNTRANEAGISLHLSPVDLEHAALTACSDERAQTLASDLDLQASNRDQLEVGLRNRKAAHLRAALRIAWTGPMFRRTARPFFAAGLNRSCPAGQQRDSFEAAAEGRLAAADHPRRRPPAATTRRSTSSGSSFQALSAFRVSEWSCEPSTLTECPPGQAIARS